MTNAADLWSCPAQRHMTIFPGMFCVSDEYGPYLLVRLDATGTPLAQ